MSRQLDELCRLDVLRLVPVQLGPRDQTHRRLYWTKEFEQWCRTLLTNGLKTNSIANLDEQLNQAFADFVTGRPMTGMTKVDPPKGQGLWKLKSPDLRMFGWADDTNCMILVAGELKRVLMSPGPPKDRDMGAKVVSKRQSLGFSEWKYGDIYVVFPKAIS